MHGAIIGIHIVPVAAASRGWAGTLCHLCQMRDDRSSGPINPYSSANLSEFTNWRPRLHQLWTRCLVSLWLLSDLAHLPAHRHPCSLLPSVKIRAGTDAQLCPTLGTSIDTAGTGTGQPQCSWAVNSSALTAVIIVTAMGNYGS